MTNRSVFLALVLVLSAGCTRAPAQPPAVIAWYDCVECTDAELTAVKALGDSAVPEFRGTLLNGPGDERMRAERQRLEKAYRDLKDYERRHPENKVQGTEQEYIDMYLAQFVMRNRLRAASALGAINTPAARTALQDALKLTNLPPPLLREIERLLPQNP